MHTAKPTLHSDWIDPFAKRIVSSLKEAGFETYLVGGCVRDLLVGIHPKDFDIATSALPQQIRRKVPNSYIIGRRFQLVLVRRGDSQFEVATFRRNVRPEDLEEGLETKGDNYFGTVEEDAQRRDFTINSMFYDPVLGKVLDHCNGMADIEARVIRMIGDPKERFVEDSIRILRAIRLAHKIDFVLDPALRSAIPECAEVLGKSALPRRREEYLKLLKLKSPDLAFLELYDLNLLKFILPTLHQLFEVPEQQEVFLRYLRRLRESELNESEPLELFAGLMFAYLKAKIGEGPWNVEKIEENPAIVNFMKDELGIFKAEAMSFFRGLQFIPNLFDSGYYKRKGERRQLAFLTNENFILAYKLADFDQQLSATERFFWLGELETKLPLGE